MWQVVSLLLLLYGEHVKAEKCNYAKRVGEFKGQILSRNWRIVRFLGRNSLAKYSVMSCSDSYSVDGKYLLCAGEVSTLEIGQNYSVHLHARY